MSQIADSKSSLPQSWLSLPIGHVSHVVSGGTPPSKDKSCFTTPGDGIPWLTPADLSNNKAQHISHGSRDLTKKGLSLCSAQILPTGSVLFSSRAPIGYVAIAQNPLSTNQGFKSFALPKEIDSRFIYYQLRHLKAVAEALATGTTFKELSGTTAARIPIALAPINEQRRIADKLDRVLARVDAANEHLSRVAPLIKRFRQSVLAAAVSGRLTDACALPSQRWKKAKLGDLGTLARGKSKHRPRNDPSLYGGRYPFIQTGDIANSNGLITHHSRTYNDKGLAQSKLWPKGTLCITIAANIADTAILGYDACFPDSVVGFLGDESTCISKFVKYSIDVIKEDIERLAPATAQKNINLALLSEMPSRIPSVEEQSEIVRRVEKLFAFADHLEERLSQAQTAVQKLTPALLAKAFRGELAPQDPNDEPASELLKRLQESRTESTKPSLARKPHARKSP